MRDIAPAKRIALALCAAVALLASLSASASAKLQQPFLSSFGSFSNVEGVAVDQSTHDVYVYDSGANAIFKFDSSGKPVNFSSTATNEITGLPFSGNAEGELAVDNSASDPAKGDIYLAHGGEAGILVFDAAGKQIGSLTKETGVPWGETCGVATDESGDVYVGIYSNEINRYVPAANPVENKDYESSIGGANKPCNVAVDSAENVFSAQWSSGPIDRYQASEFGSASATGSVVDAKGSSLAVDRSRDDVYVDETNGVARFGPNGEPFEAPLNTFASSGEGAISGSYGIAVSEANGDVYVSDGKGKISVFGPAVEVPTLTTGEASNIGLTEATVSGSVNPEGNAVTKCEFEYGNTTSYGRTASCSTSPGSGSTAVQETASLAELEPGTEYHYRLVAANANGVEVGVDNTFKTLIPWPSSPTGLPDGRVYEQVSPRNKSGNVVPPEAFGLASEDGNAVAYYGSGAMGTSYDSLPGERVSRRTSSGWTTVSPIPTPLGDKPTFSEPTTFVPSSDFLRELFTASSPYVSAEPLEGQPVNIFLTEDPAREPLWLGQPSTPNPIPALGTGLRVHDYVIAGASPSLDKVYFTYSGTLLPEDAGRAAYVGGGEGQGVKPWGFYEWSGGSLREAGTLPDGSLNQFGAVPAAVAGFHEGDPEPREGKAYQAEAMHNEVSQDGTRAFFVSPDPISSSVSDPRGCREATCTSEPPELYVHEAREDGSHAVTLLSRSELPGHEGEPAPDGVTQVANTTEANGATYVQGSLDGSHAFFTSTDRLTQAAPEDQTVKEYDFDLETGALTYLPGVAGPIIVSVEDGSAFVFENTEANTIDVWQSGPGGGSVRTIAQMPTGSGITYTTGGRASADGSVFVFRTNSELPGFNNAGNFEQLYRYDARTEELDCVSCPPAGVAPSGNVGVSQNNFEGNKFNGSNGLAMTTLDTRIISSDGSRVFFDTPDPLVARDTNGQRDVYEWENGNIYLISTGKSPEPSTYLDSSASGGDVFFVTASGLAGGDTDEAFDAYDARIPRPGDNPPPAAVPCQGDVCQGPPSVPSLLGVPASATFNGLGNRSMGPAHKPPHRKCTRRRRKRCGQTRHHRRRCGKTRRHRIRCRRARRHHRATAKRKAGRSSGRAFHGKGRSR